VSHRASLDVSAAVLKAVTGWIARHRRRPGSRPAQRAGTVHAQVALVLRWLRHRLDLRTLAAEAGLSIATAYRYLHEALDVIASTTSSALVAIGTAPPSSHLVRTTTDSRPTSRSTGRRRHDLWTTDVLAHPDGCHTPSPGRLRGPPRNLHRCFLL
jgi:hypothetical protein